MPRFELNGEPVRSQKPDWHPMSRLHDCPFARGAWQVPSPSPKPRTPPSARMHSPAKQGTTGNESMQGWPWRPDATHVPPTHAAKGSQRSTQG
jgi:hypothetical protein